jgi:peroxiredoxin
MNKKTIVYIGLAGIVVVVIGIALSNTSKTAEQKQESVATTNNLVGKPLPDIQLKDKTGKIYELTSLKGKNVVLFFNEGLMCYPACWNQMASFATDPRFNSGDTVALSVVTDPAASWETASAKMPDLAKATILFDTASDDPNAHHGDATNTASYKLGMLSVGSSMHPGQSPGHTYILIDKQGIVREVMDDANMAVNNDQLIEKISKY